MATLLLVDDEKPVREGLAAYIRQASPFFSEVLTAKNGKTALEIFEKTKVDVALIDINLGDFNGLDLIALIKKRFPSVLIVVISGYDDFEYVRKALTLKVQDYLLKPIPQSDLIKLLQDLEQRVKPTPPVVPVGQPDLAHLAYQYIQQNYPDRSISLQQAATALFISTSQLNKLLKKAYGSTFSELLIQYRLDKAKELLQTDLHYPISEIANKVGYEDPHYFSRLFRKKTGQSPVQYREANFNAPQI